MKVGRIPGRRRGTIEAGAEDSTCVSPLVEVWLNLSRAAQRTWSSWLVLNRLTKACVPIRGKREDGFVRPWVVDLVDIWANSQERCGQLGGGWIIKQTVLLVHLPIPRRRHLLVELVPITFHTREGIGDPPLKQLDEGFELCWTLEVVLPF